MKRKKLLEWSSPCCAKIIAVALFIGDGAFALAEGAGGLRREMKAEKEQYLPDADRGDCDLLRIAAKAVVHRRA